MLSWCLGIGKPTEQAALEMSTDIFYAGHNWHPMFLQGTKTLGYEIWEDLGFRIPDNIVIPASAGSNVLGCHLAFTELVASGEADRLPKLFMGATCQLCAGPRKFPGGRGSPAGRGTGRQRSQKAPAIRNPVRLQQMLTALRDTGGGTVAVSEDASAAQALSSPGVGCTRSPLLRSGPAGFGQLIEQGTLAEHEETVVILTGSGLKATPFYAGMAEPSKHTPPHAET